MMANIESGINMNEFEKRLYADLAGAKAIFDEQERLKRLISPHDALANALAAATPDVAQLSAVQAALDEQNRVRNLLAPLEDPALRQMALAAPSVTETLAQQSVRELTTLRKSYAEIEAARQLASAQDLYRLPTWDTLLEREVKRVVAESSLLSTAAPSSWLETMKQSVLLRQQPWLNEAEPMSSIRALTEMQVLGAAINAANPFSDAVTEATRKVLGDWSKVTSLPPEVFTDAYARRDFYLAHGYDAALSTLPAAARLEGLYLSGLIDAPSMTVDVAVDADQTEISVEVDGYALASEAREMLAALERELRQFIDGKLKAVHGHAWTKQRVPAGIAQTIRQRRADDLRINGKSHPAVEYLDFPDYAPIITRSDNWTEFFKDYFQRPESVAESFVRLAPIRNAVMHSRPLTQEDMDFLYVEVRRLQIAMRRTIPTDAEAETENN
ncbi:Swt1 family HEPN domain-containing protein [Duganella callida]|uniref:Swt1-like HEPN domain-containing protein n=1 Tax=Duganella callida TaxID=2561932 RepID=A0A4Y9SHZ7_9BURK|nr:Swt1 family HEPN domain-containing protein [Duganella callida]TFW20119.1 hypothetical protein E4L98_15430 [Duganella callida]